MKTIRILFIISGLNTGGAEMALVRLLRHLPSSIEAQVISLTDIGTVGRQLLEAGVPLVTLGMSSGQFSLIAFLRLCRLIRQAEPDIVQTWMYHADLLGGVASRLVGIPRVIWGVRHSNLEPLMNKTNTLLVAKVCAWCSRWIPAGAVSCSEVAKQAHLKFGYSVGLFRVIPNGIELSQFHPNPISREAVRLELGLAANVALVGFVARYHPQKNHEGFLEAVALVHQARPDVHFVLIGPEVETANAQLVEMLVEHGVRDVVHLLGERNDVPHLMAALDALALASWGEAFPNVLAEAMACGVPCVSTRAGDAELIIGDTGYTVALGDMSALAGALTRLLSEPEALRNLRSQKARARVTSYFDIRSVAQDYASLYQSLL